MLVEAASRLPITARPTPIQNSHQMVPKTRERPPTRKPTMMMLTATQDTGRPWNGSYWPGVAGAMSLRPPSSVPAPDLRSVPTWSAMSAAPLLVHRFLATGAGRYRRAGRNCHRWYILWRGNPPRPRPAPRNAGRGRARSVSQGVTGRGPAGSVLAGWAGPGPGPGAPEGTGVAGGGGAGFPLGRNGPSQPGRRQLS